MFNLQIHTASPDQEIYIVGYFDAIFKEYRTKQVAKCELKELEQILEKSRATDIKMWRFLVSGEPIGLTSYQKVILDS